MRRKLRSWRAYAAVAAGMVTLAGTAVLAAAPAQASATGHTGVSSSLARTAAAHPRPKAGHATLKSAQALKSAEAHYTDAGCNAASLKKNYAQCFAMVYTAIKNKIAATPDQPPAGALGPSDIQGAYKLPATGQGQTVAIVDAYAQPDMPGDANQFAIVTGDQPFRKGQYAQHLDRPFTQTAACGASGWYGEETLDIEAVHGQAPDANVRFVAAASCFDTDLADAEAYIVDNHVASIVSNSWGEPADQSSISSVFDQIFQAGAAEGIGFFFSSGDSGYEDPAGEDPGSDQIQVDYPTSSPWVTSVGGTSLAIGRTGNYEWETSWGTMNVPLASNGTSWSVTPPGTYPANYDGSAGGGVSTQYAQPSYQRGVVPNSLATSLPNGTKSSTPMRVEPDVSALADPSTGMMVGQTVLQPDGTTFAFSLSRIGGTSVACPVFAGIEADAQQAAGHPLGPGFLAEVRNNYTNSATKQGPLLTFLRTLGIDGEGAAALPAVRGYDDSTGVGSPRNYIQSFG